MMLDNLTHPMNESSNGQHGPDRPHTEHTPSHTHTLSLSLTLSHSLSHTYTYAHPNIHTHSCHRPPTLLQAYSPFDIVQLITWRYIKTVHHRVSSGEIYINQYSTPVTLLPIFPAVLPDDALPANLGNVFQGRLLPWLSSVNKCNCGTGEELCSLVSVPLLPTEMIHVSKPSRV